MVKYPRSEQNRTFPEVNLINEYDNIKHLVKKSQFPSDCKISAMLNKSYLMSEFATNRKQYEQGDNVFEMIYTAETYSKIKR